MAKHYLCLLLALLMVLSLAGCKNEEEPALRTEAPAEITEAPATEPPATEAPTEAPTEPPVVIHSGMGADGSFNEGTLFIGDSLTF